MVQATKSSKLWALIATIISAYSIISFKINFSVYAWVANPSLQAPKTRHLLRPILNKSFRFQAVLADHDDVVIRDSAYAELPKVADVIVAAFYPNSTGPFRTLFRLAELNRIQQCFTYSNISLHRMLVAEHVTGRKKQIVGFCDVDARQPNRPTGYTYNPRPYISDLCIHPDFRRLGIAKRMIEACEGFAKDIGKREVFIRVQSVNVLAVNMYEKLGYNQIDNPDCKDGSIILLRKSLVEQMYVMLNKTIAWHENDLLPKASYLNSPSNPMKPVNLKMGKKGFSGS